MPDDTTRIPCNNCGKLCTWGMIEGKWKVLEGGKLHVCKKRYNEPIDTGDAQRLSRELARLSTAIENLTDELRRTSHTRSG